MDSFPIRSYTKKDLALAYFPTSENPHSAVNHLMSWEKMKPTINELLSDFLNLDFDRLMGKYNN